jgi:very-short-patch-repair endonuclease
MGSGPRKPRQRYASNLLASACSAARQGIASREQLSAKGITRGLLARALRTGDLVRLRRGVYGLGPLPIRGRHLLSDGTVDLAYLAEVRAVLLSLNAVADLRTAALFWGMDMLVEPAVIECRVPRSKRRVSLRGVSARSSEATSSIDLGIRKLDPVPVTTATDTVLDCALSRPLLEAVVIADSALRVGCVTVDDLVKAVAGRKGPGRTRLLRLVELIDPESGSVLESMLRYLLVTNGLTPQPQFRVRSRDGKREIGRFDFCFEAARLIIECDGRRWHDPEDVRRKDRHKDNELARLGWRVLRFDWNEVRHSEGYVLAAVRDCLGIERLAA